LQSLAFASAAHEFKNPLNAIVSSLDLLEPLIDKNRGGNFFKIAKNCSNLMLFLIKDFLDFSQLEANSLILNHQPVFLFKIINDCINVLRFKANEKGIQLNVENLESNMISKDSIIMTDENRVKQILINLISNAIKYTEEG
jgi:signal transduction histidine kinase